MAIGRPILLNEDWETEAMTPAVLNYFQDAEVHMDKLEETLEIVKRENAYFVKENKEIAELKAKLDYDLCPECQEVMCECFSDQKKH